MFSVTHLSQEGSLSTTGETSMLVHPTDFTPAGALAFAHAVRLALRGRETLSLLNIATDDLGPRRNGLRQVADLLAKWNLLPEKAPPESLKDELGLNVVSVGMPAADAREGLLEYLDDHPCDIAVLATRDHRGLARWLERSVAKRALRRAKTMVLMVREGSRGFVDPKTGDFALRRVLVPVDNGNDPSLALSRLEAWLGQIGAAPEIRLIYVGSNPPIIGPRPDGVVYSLIELEGPVAQTILEEARRWSADLIALPTAPSNAMIAAVRGSVGSALLDDASWPLLAVPMS